MNTRLFSAVVAAFAAVGLVAGCGGGSSTPKASPTPPPYNETTAKAQITANWQTLFDSTKPVAAKVGLLQDGANLEAVLQQQARSPLTQGSSAKVKTIVVAPSHTTATVTYDILRNGTPSLANQHGTAVYEGGTWKVAKATFCVLVRLAAQFSNSPVPTVCSP
jgi:hypothetical protein